MNKKVTITELLMETVVLAIGLTGYYWCFARTDWKDYYSTIQYCLAFAIIVFFVAMASRIRKYKKEEFDELAYANLKRCDAICLKIFAAMMIVTAFVGGAMGHVTNVATTIGWVIMICICVISVIRVLIFSIMDKKGI